MTNYVELTLRRNRGWPWPEDSWGLTPLYGEDGWCRSCGVPKHEQTGSLILQPRGMSRVDGAWVPNWLFDVYCLEVSLAAKVATQWSVEMLPVLWHGAVPGEASQILVRSAGSKWFSDQALGDITRKIHGTAGATCPACKVWRWMPVGMADLPCPPADIFEGDVPVVASPEWFGDGGQAFRQILWRRDLAELLSAASPRDFRIQVVG